MLVIIEGGVGKFHCMTQQDQHRLLNPICFAMYAALRESLRVEGAEGNTLCRKLGSRVGEEEGDKEDYGAGPGGVRWMKVET